MDQFPVGPGGRTADYCVLSTPFYISIFSQWWSAGSVDEIVVGQREENTLLFRIVVELIPTGEMLRPSCWMIRNVGCSTGVNFELGRQGPQTGPQCCNSIRDNPGRVKTVGWLVLPRIPSRMGLPQVAGGGPHGWRQATCPNYQRYLYGRLTSAQHGGGGGGRAG